MKTILIILVVLVSAEINLAQTSEDAKKLLQKMNETMATATEYTAEMKMTMYEEGKVLSESEIKVVKKDERLYTKNGTYETLADGDVRIYADHASHTLIYGEIMHLGANSEKKDPQSAHEYIPELDGQDYNFSNITRKNGALNFDIVFDEKGIFKSMTLVIDETTFMLRKLIYTYNSESVDRVEIEYSKNVLSVDKDVIPSKSQFVKGSGKSASAQKSYQSYRFINQVNS